MTTRESKRLKIGDRVVLGVWAGTVIDTGYAAVTIKWDDNQTGMVDHRDMQDIRREG